MSTTSLRRADTMGASSRFAPIPPEESTDEPDDVFFSSLYGVRSIELNRPKKLNSLNASMARKIIPRLKEWENSQMANIIMISGAGEKAFCAGGDVTELAKQNSTPEGQQKSRDYFALEYRLDHLIATYSKPYIAVLDGITMGGGVGLSVSAPFRLATERTVFAMPETTIGFFPDVGASFFLPRLDGEIGTYLALTSERLMGVQTFYAGIATHYIDSSQLAQLTSRLSELEFKDYSQLPERLQLINATINEFISFLPSPDSYEKAKYGNLTGPLREAIDRCFKYDEVEDILDALEREQENNSEFSDWAKATVKTIKSRSPTSCKVTLRQLRVGREWDISETFIREHGIASEFMAHSDFVEGISARLISKPPKQPEWQPATLEEVSSDDVAKFLEPPSTKLKLFEPSKNALNQGYREYPHARLALPREKDIKAVVQADGKHGSKKVTEAILKEWQGKEGVREKIQDVLTRKTEQQQDRSIHWTGT